MPLFVCSKCGCIDNTACDGNFWDVYTNNPLCTECNGYKWHNYFPKKKATEKEIKEINEYWEKNLKE